MIRLRKLPGRLLLLEAAAWLWRRLMWRTTFIAVTGSLGKTTAKDALAACLSSRYPIVASLLNQNDRPGRAKTVLRVRPWHRYAVVEVGAGDPNGLSRAGRLLRPEITVVLSIAREHTQTFRTLDLIAAEKSELVKRTRPNGLVVLNADEPRLAAMRSVSPARVLTFGTAGDCDTRIGDASSVWPERLRFVLEARGRSTVFQTQLVGIHWVPALAGAVTVAMACGVSLDECATAIGNLTPRTARMEPVQMANGAVIIRDEYKSGVDTLPAAFKVLREARATRRWLVFGSYEERVTAPRASQFRVRMKGIAPKIPAMAECVLFVGKESEAGHAAAIAAGLPPDRVFAVPDVRAAQSFLQQHLEPGDVALLKGPGHLSRAYLATVTQVGCWVDDCGIPRSCDRCRWLAIGFPSSAKSTARKRASEDPRPSIAGGRRRR